MGSLGRRFRNILITQSRAYGSTCAINRGETSAYDAATGVATVDDSIIDVKGFFEGVRESRLANFGGQTDTRSKSRIFLIPHDARLTSLEQPLVGWTAEIAAQKYSIREIEPIIADDEMIGHRLTLELF